MWYTASSWGVFLAVYFYIVSCLRLLIHLGALSVCLWKISLVISSFIVHPKRKFGRVLFSSFSGLLQRSKISKRLFCPWIFPMLGIAKSTEPNHTGSSSLPSLRCGSHICVSYVTRLPLITQRYWPASETMFDRPLIKISDIPSCSPFIISISIV